MAVVEGHTGEKGEGDLSGVASQKQGTSLCTSESSVFDPCSQRFCHLKQQDPAQQLHGPHRERAAAAGRGPGPDGGVVPGKKDQARALPPAPHL